MTAMAGTHVTVRRSLFAAFAVCAAGGATIAALSGSSPSATAASDPCAASQVAKTIGSVANSTGYYLDSHPQTNQALTTISQQQGGPQSLAALKTYFDANPQAAKDMQALQRPLTDLAGQCKLPVTLPQVLGLLQSAQQGGGAAGLPGSLPGAQAVGVPGSALPAQSSPVSAAVQGAGPLPGPAR
ncbi:hemophore [Mycobacteriaceae bacterium 1482268.1]|nr:hemophore [Mycobacteriaceae bacterium 1482268.1]